MAWPLPHDVRHPSIKNEIGIIATMTRPASRQTRYVRPFCFRKSELAVKALAQVWHRCGRRATQIVMNYTSTARRRACGLMRKCTDSVVFSAGNHLSWLLTSHPLQVGAGYNQLIPLFVTITDRELFHARRQNSTSSPTPHAVRAWRCPLLYL